MTLQELVNTITTRLQQRWDEIVNPEPIVIHAKKTPKPAPSSAPTMPDVERKIRMGFRKYSDTYAGSKRLPIEDYIPLFVQAAEKYPIFKQHPYLLPQVSILESSAGQNVTRENNPLNWGARVQKQGLYSPKSWEQSITDAITAIAGDIKTRPPGTTRFRQTAYYEPFRQSGDLRTFANIYEPANQSYYKNLLEGIKAFEE